MVDQNPYCRDERFVGIGDDRTLEDFWRWAYSDVLVNTNRALLAEYLIACALGTHKVRRLEWDAVDIRYGRIRVEVKSSGYVQAWTQTKLSEIRFDISPKKGWDAVENTFAEEVARFADVYCFCLYTCEEKDRNLLLDVKNWTFYIVKTSRLDELYKSQKSIGLASIQEIATVCQYHEIRECVDRIFA